MKIIKEYQQINDWYEPTDLLRANKDYISLMSREEHGFLSGLLKLVNPKKIVEIGVAQGGTTALISKSMELLKSPCEIHSIDILEKIPQAKKFGLNLELSLKSQYREIGYIFKKYPVSDYVKHKFYLGHTLPEVIEKIQGGIDMVILDTNHRIPGEILDFLCVLPYLSKGGIVVLHDVNLNLVRTLNKYEIEIGAYEIATKVLFTSVVADKYYNFNNKKLYNIAAFKITDETYDYIEDIFYSLSYAWFSPPVKEIIKNYRMCFEKNYPDFCLSIFDACVKYENEYRKSLGKVKQKLTKDINIAKKNVMIKRMLIKIIKGSIFK